MIPYERFYCALACVSDCNDFEEYAVETGSSIPLDDAQQVIRLLKAVWAMAHDGLTIKSIAAACQRSIRSIAICYGIPIRTVENWSCRTNTPPSWALPFIAYVVLSDYMADVPDSPSTP